MTGTSTQQVDKLTLQAQQEFLKLSGPEQEARIAEAHELALADEESRQKRATSYLFDPQFLKDPLLLGHLVSVGADVNASRRLTNGAIETPLQLAAGIGLSTVRDLYAHGARVEGDPVAVYKTVLQGRISFPRPDERLEILKFLLDHGADPNPVIKGWSTPLQMAARVKLVGAVKLLLERGADPNIDPTDNGYAGALYFTITHEGRENDHPTSDLRGSTEIVSLLLQHGANPNALVTHLHNPPVTPAFLAIDSKNLGALRALKEGGADMSATLSPTGWNLLHYAAVHGTLGTVQYLVEEAGLDVHQRTRDGKLAAELKYGSGNEEGLETERAIKAYLVECASSCSV